MKRIIIAPDYTPEQRRERKQLLEKLQEAGKINEISFVRDAKVIMQMKAPSQSYQQLDPTRREQPENQGHTQIHLVDDLTNGSNYNNQSISRYMNDTPVTEETTVRGETGTTSGTTFPRCKWKLRSVFTFNSRRTCSYVNRQPDKLLILYINADTLTNKLRSSKRILQTKINPRVVAVTECNPKTSQFDVNVNAFIIYGSELFTSLQYKGRGVLI